MGDQYQNSHRDSSALSEIFNLRKERITVSMPQRACTVFSTISYVRRYNVLTLLNRPLRSTPSVSSTGTYLVQLGNSPRMTCDTCICDHACLNYLRSRSSGPNRGSLMVMFFGGGLLRVDALRFSPIGNIGASTPCSDLGQWGWHNLATTITLLRRGR